MMVYNNPIDTKVDLTPDLLAEIAQIENIVAVKEFSGDVRRILEIRELAPDLAVAGADDLTLEALLMGDRLVRRVPERVPKESVRLYDLAVQGKLEEARALYEPLVAAFRWDSRVEFVQAIKYGYGLRRAAARAAPRGPLVPEHVAQLEQDMKKAVESLRWVRRTITAIDSHTEGMPTRVVTGGVGVIPSTTMAERREYFVKHLDDLHVPDERAARSLRDERRDPAAADPLRRRLGRAVHRGVRLPADVRSRHHRRGRAGRSGMVEVTEPITKVGWTPRPVWSWWTLP